MKGIIILTILLSVIFVIGCSDNSDNLKPSEVNSSMKIKSTAFSEGGMIPSKYTADGGNVSPPLSIEGVPANAQSLALIVDDPDAPMGVWTHWIVFDIDPKTTNIPDGSIPGKQGMNDFRKNNYGGPSPPSGTHRYRFKLYALDSKLGLNEGARLPDVVRAMKGHVIAESVLTGNYKRK